jgi:hypothetical protein
LVGKSEGKKPIGKPRCKWVDNIEVDHVEIERGSLDWIGLAHDRYSCRTLVCDKVLSDSIKCWVTTDWLNNCWALE